MTPEFIPKKYRRPLRFSRLVQTEDIAHVQILQDFAAPLIIGPSLDPVFRTMTEEASSSAHLLTWEDFGRRWDYRICDNQLRIVAGGLLFPVSGVYVRGFEATDSDANRADMMIFMNLLATLNIPRLGTTDLGISNTSKILHLHTAVRAAAEGLPSIATPETLLIKSAHVTGCSLANRMGPSVAKSLSSTRTQVFGDDQFRFFGPHRPANVPVLIQKKKRGLEVRVHVIDGELFPLGIRANNNQVDYRYNEDVEMLFDVELSPDEAEFCRRIQMIEQNPLVGVDLIRDGDQTFCFEANPNPGWASFPYPAEICRRLAQSILTFLGSKK